jgi:hypothetical protein
METLCIVYTVVCASLHFGLSHIFIGVNQSTKYWTKVHVKYTFYTVKWAVPQNFRDKIFLLSVDNGFFVIKNSKIQYGNCNFYILISKTSSASLWILTLTEYVLTKYTFLYFFSSVGLSNAALYPGCLPPYRPPSQPRSVCPHSS